MAVPFGLTKDGIESQFGTNHLGHFLLTQTLLPAILKAGTGARIVNVSSAGHAMTPPGGINFDDLLNQESKGVDNWQRYGASKLANILFTQELTKRYGSQGIYANAVHPGVVRTELLRGFLGDGRIGQVLLSIVNLITMPLFLSPQRGALTSLYCAASPEIEDKALNGQYFYPIAKHYPEGLSSYAKNEELGRKLWDFSEEYIQKVLARK
jgi:NAD(P)-dependent dehydrogenase (short-subunit alcohol dehydrogenase family)